MKTKEGWPEGLPDQISTLSTLENALLCITQPIKAIAEALPWGKAEPPIENMAPFKTTLLNFLNQLDFLIDNSEIHGKSVLFAEVKYPFNVTYEEKEEEVENV